MAVVHHTTMRPTKLELLTDWLPAQPWYQGEARTELTRAGGFRLDDPAGEVGIEFMIVTTSGAGTAAYLLPLTYRGAPLDGAEQALIGTSEHGVLGTRWIYDGTQDPVLLAQLTSLLRGEAVAQAQSESNTPDPTVRVQATDAEEGELVIHRQLPHPAADGSTGTVVANWQQPDGTRAESVIASR